MRSWSRILSPQHFLVFVSLGTSQHEYNPDCLADVFLSSFTRLWVVASENILFVERAILKHWQLAKGSSSGRFQLLSREVQNKSVNRFLKDLFLGLDIHPPWGGIFFSYHALWGTKTFIQDLCPWNMAPAPALRLIVIDKLTSTERHWVLIIHTSSSSCFLFFWWQCRGSLQTKATTSHTSWVVFIASFFLPGNVRWPNLFSHLGIQ